MIVWALAQDSFTKNQVTQPVREAVATEFGLWLLATVILMLGAGLTIGFRVARRPPRAPARLRMGAAAGTVAFVVPIVLVFVLAASDRGLGGTISKGYESLTSISKETPGGPGRLLSASSARGQYWHQAKEVFLDHYWKGSGAETFGVTRLRYRTPNDRTVPQHAHGYIHQTMADLGTAGLLVSFALLIAWLVAAARATGFPHRRDHKIDFTPERIGLVALALVALVFGMHSLIDWVWFVPGPAAMALVAAGFVAGRGRVGAATPAVVAATNGHLHAEREALAAVHTRPPVPVGAGSGSGVALADLPPHPPQPAPPPPARAPRSRFTRPALAALTLAVAALCAWAIWQPLRSDQESDHALDLAANNRTDAARAAARKAHDIDPLSPRPYVVLNAVEDAAGNRPAALKALEQAVIEFPGDPQTWLQLAQYQLNSLSLPADALKTVAGALYLDPQSRAAQTVYFTATTATGVTAATPAPPPRLPRPLRRRPPHPSPRHQRRPRPAAAAPPHRAAETHR